MASHKHPTCGLPAIQETYQLMPEVDQKLQEVSNTRSIPAPQRISKILHQFIIWIKPVDNASIAWCYHLQPLDIVCTLYTTSSSNTRPQHTLAYWTITKHRYNYDDAAPVLSFLKPREDLTTHHATHPSLFHLPAKTPPLSPPTQWAPRRRVRDDKSFKLSPHSLVESSSGLVVGARNYEGDAE